MTPRTSVGSLFERSVRPLIRPPRLHYQLSDLGPRQYRLGYETFLRTDLELENYRGQKLLCSHVVPSPKGQARNLTWEEFEEMQELGSPQELRRPCVIFLHGNSSSRMEGFGIMRYLLDRGLSVFCFDFSGSGMSEGEYISLGWHEEQDLKVVIEYLRRQGSVSSIGLWGRSMGAATAILRAADDHKVGGCVLDSPFGNLSLVAEEIMRKTAEDYIGLNVPDFLIKLGLEIISNEASSRADFDMMKVNPLEYASGAICPAIFGVARDDSFVQPHHTWDVYKAWGGKSTLREFEGDHNGIRPTWFLEEAAAFLSEKLHAAGGIQEPELLSRRQSPTVSTPRSLVTTTRRNEADVTDSDCDELGAAVKHCPRLSLSKRLGPLINNALI